MRLALAPRHGGIPHTRTLSVYDRVSLVPKPPESAAEAVERLGRVRKAECFLKRIACVFPVARCERLVPAGEASSATTVVTGAWSHLDFGNASLVQSESIALAS